MNIPISSRVAPSIFLEPPRVNEVIVAINSRDVPISKFRPIPIPRSIPKKITDTDAIPI